MIALVTNNYPYTHGVKYRIKYIPKITKFSPQIQKTTYTTTVYVCLYILQFY